MQRYRCKGIPVEGQNEELMVVQGDIDALHAGKERAMHAPGAPEDARAAAAARGLVRGGRNGRVEEPLIPGRP